EAPSNPNVVYAAYKRQGVLRSIDGGRSFHTVAATAISSYTITCMTVHPGNPDIVMAGATTPNDQTGRRYSVLLRSTNGAASWSVRYHSSSSPSLPSIATIVFDPGNPEIILAG